jgi:hypothetical protein
MAISAAVTYCVITVGQVQADAFYVFHWVPLFAAGLTPAVRLAPRILSHTLTIGIIVTSVAMAALSYWRWDAKPPIVEWKGVPLVDKFDSRRIAAIAREAMARGRPSPDHWPIAEIVRIASRWTSSKALSIGILSREGEFPRYLELANLRFEGLRIGRDVVVDYLQLSRIRSASDAAEHLGTLDVLCVDAAVATPVTMRAIGQHFGLDLGLLAEFAVTEKWKFFVFGIRKTDPPLPK